MLSSKKKCNQKSRTFMIHGIPHKESLQIRPLPQSISQPSRLAYFFLCISHFLGFPSPVQSINGHSEQKKLPYSKNVPLSSEKPGFLKLLFHSILQTVWIESLPEKGSSQKLESQKTVDKKGDKSALSNGAKSSIAIKGASSSANQPKKELVKKTLQPIHTSSKEIEQSSFRSPIATPPLLKSIENLKPIALTSSSPVLLPTPKKKSEISPSSTAPQTKESTMPTNCPAEDSIILRFPFAVPKRNSIEVQTDEYPSAPPLVQKTNGTPSDPKKLENGQEAKKQVHFAADSPFFIHPPRPANKQNPTPSPLRPPSPDILDQTTDFFKNVVSDVGGFFDKILPFSEGGGKKSPDRRP